MELKSYQKKSNKRFRYFLEYLQKYPTSALAFKNYWENKKGA